MSSGLEVSLSQDLLMFTLVRPERGNSFDIECARTLLSAIKQYKGKFRGVILCADPGRIFSAGGDLKYYANLKPLKKGVLVNREIRKALQALADVPVPTVAVVTGDCLGGGVEVVSAFDRILATPESHFGLWQRKIGLIFGWGGGERLLKRLSDAQLKSLSLETRLIGSYEAASIGLVDEVVPAWQIRNKAEDWLLRQKSLPQKPQEYLKALKTAPKYFEKLWGNPEHKSVLVKFNK